ncbi:outer membrane beta-barrel protein [Flagellimonas marinaquae]|uniref:outer membrane beta-barrel protein n=1 Tax=Flagellimonas marinaquae TaxID=254955 RepID=UPI00207650C4|nr:outer membrane beta-barrel protein [Allomuricauda aquimarina]USD25554.1 PorT family protein [Allomuricauda aquimarina]
MKYYNLLVCLAFFFSLTVKSQNSEIGFRTGVNFATLRTGDNTGTANTGSIEYLTRLNFSITYELIFSNHFGLDVSLGYQGRDGGDFDEESKLRIGIDNFKSKLDYVNATTLFRYYPFNDQQFQPFITLGPGFSYLIKTD